MIVPPPSLDCSAGDCNQNSSVTINEVFESVTILLEEQTVSVCPEADPDGDTRVKINEVLRAARNYQIGCSSAGASGGSGSGPSAVTLSVRDTSPVPDTTFLLPIDIAGSDNTTLVGVEFDLLYNQTKLAPASVGGAFCTFAQSETNNHFPSAALTVIASPTSPPPPPGLQRMRVKVLDLEGALEGSPAIVQNGRLLSCWFHLAPGVSYGQTTIVDGELAFASTINGIDVPTAISEGLVTSAQPAVQSFLPARDLEINDLVPAGTNCPHTMGGYEVAYAGFWSGKNGLIRRYLLHFDVSSIPAGATVLSATFEHQVLVHQPPAQSLPMFAGQVTRTGWLDTTANWAKYFCNTNGSGALSWTAAGGDFTQQDSVSWSTQGAGHKEVGVTSLVQRIVNSGGQLSMIVRMLDDSSATQDRYVKIATKEAQGSYEKPHLDVTWRP